MGPSVVRTLVLAVALATVPVVPDAAAAPAEHRLVPKMSAVYEVTADGVLHATETIDFAFGEQTYSGFCHRQLPVRQPATGSPYRPADLLNRGDDRVWRVSAVTASTPAGANLDVRLREFDPQNQAEEMGFESRRRELCVEIDDPDKAHLGRVSYVLRYEVRGALDRVGNEYELWWPVVMVGYWMTGEVAARLSVPGGLISVSCGAAEPVPCTPVRLGPSAVRFETRALPDEPADLEFTARVPATGVAETDAILDDPPRSGSQTGALRALPVVAVLLMIVAGAGLLVRLAWKDG